MEQKRNLTVLICLYREHEKMFTLGKMKQYLCWEWIATKMAKEGCNVSERKCCTKFQTLKRTYKQIKDHNNKSGNSRKTWEYFDAMDELCGTKPWIEPISTASSHPDDQLAQSLGPKRKSKGKIHSVTSKYTLLEYRKLRAEKRDAQLLRPKEAGVRLAVTTCPCFKSRRERLIDCYFFGLDMRYQTRFHVGVGPHLFY